MSDVVLSALIGAGSTLIVTIIVQIYTVYISNIKEILKNNQINLLSKRENLSAVYQILISVINSFPNESPNDVLKNIQYGPNYSLENFDNILEILDYQLDDYRNQLKNVNIDYEQKNNIDEQISNREYAKKQISGVRDKYYNARNNYNSFGESNKMIFDLYAGQNVRNNLVVFDVVINNVFKSGHSVGDVYDPFNNNIDISRRNLIDSMRNDLGIN